MSEVSFFFLRFSLFDSFLSSALVCVPLVMMMQVCVYGAMVVLMWGQPLISFSPDYLWPSCFSHALSGGRIAGSVGALSIVAMFVFGLVPRFSPTA